MPRSSGQGSLFERLDPDPPARRSRTRQAWAADRVRAIKTHLEQVLNARLGGSQSCPGLGLPDMNDAASGQQELRNQLCGEIRNLVNLYEPRVRVTDVSPLSVDEPLSGLCFRMQCQLTLPGALEHVEIDLLVHQRQQRICVR